MGLKTLKTIDYVLERCVPNRESLAPVFGGEPEFRRAHVVLRRITPSGVGLPREARRAKRGEAGGDRTRDHKLKRLVLYQLSYRPTVSDALKRQNSRAKIGKPCYDVKTNITGVERRI